MNSSKFIFICIMVWCCNYTVEVQSEKQKALIFNQETYQLMELRDDDDSAKCTHCITACPLSTEIIRKAAVSGYGVLVREVYENAENPTKVKTDICDNPITPTIVYNTWLESFQMGYEMFYRKGQLTEMPCSDYSYLSKVIDGVPDPQGKHIIDDPNMYRNNIGRSARFEFRDNPHGTMVFFWIPVITLEIIDENRREVTMKKDIINDYFHKHRVISHCENYYLSIGDQVVPLKRKQDEFKQPADDNRLEKTQILPMHMLHTSSGRLATCFYSNIAFIWGSIANGQLQEVDLFLYALYKLHPSNINIYFGVKGESSEDTSHKLTASEEPIFLKYPTPEFMYRIVEWSTGPSVEYKVIVAIHNDPKFIEENDRLCSNSDQVKGWEDIKSSDTSTTAGTSYTCPYSGKNTQTVSKMELRSNYKWESFSAERFPTIDESDGHIFFKDISGQVRDEFNRLKSLQNQV
ncbi:uncharacterized protein LOC135847095 [Planococcus citri]|uniref:uncharacterized protein LOC135847095 n=1 Tax=Planococcus citri TaxID=170843 RepID=UPI0031FA24C6